MEKEKLLESLKELSGEVANLDVKIGEIIKEVQENTEEKGEESEDSPSIPLHLQMEQKSVIKRIWNNPVLATWCLIILLVIGLSFFFYAFINMDREGLACQHQPFKWGAEKVLDDEVNGLYCDCSTDDKRKFMTNFGGYNPYFITSLNLSFNFI